MYDNVSECVIYALCEPTTEEVRYVGKAINLKRRLQQHPYRKNNARLSRWFATLKKLGTNPICKTLERTDNAHWRERERHWISKYRDAGNDLFNVADGGDGVDFLDEAVRRYIGKIHKGRKLKLEHAHAFLVAGQKAAQSPDSRAKRIASLKGKPSPLRGKTIHDENSKRRISLAHIGKPKSDQTKNKLRQANLGHKDSPAVRTKKSLSHMGLPGPNKGETFSLATRQKQSEARRGKKRGPEFCKVMSQRLAGVPKSQAHRLKMSLRMQGWTPSEEMKAKSQAARRILMQTSKEFRDRSLSGLAKCWQDPEVKRKRAEGNRRRLLPIRLEFERWLTLKPAARVPLTQAAFRRHFNVSQGTITKWKKEALKGIPQVADEIT